jgi:hypothetical protein
MINSLGERAIEPGSFELMLGSSSADIRLKGEFIYQSKMP